MSRAEELLDSLTEAYDSEISNESDQHIVIGTDRVIIVPDELKRIAVQYDHNMRTVTFDCPRYYDGRDMSTMIVYIIIAGPLGLRASYIADNVRVDEQNDNVIHFDWTIKRNITQANGNLKFSVCICKTDAKGNEENHWNSEINKDLYIAEGMPCTNQDVVDDYPDIITQLLSRMNDVENNASTQSMKCYVVQDTQPEDKSVLWIDSNDNGDDN